MRNLSRRELNRLLAIGAAGALTGCSGSTQGSANFAQGVASLPFASFPALMGAGGAVTVDVPSRFPIVVARTSNTEAIALSATCTHAFCIMAWDGQGVHCPCHNANFGVDGRVISGPTSIPIPVYPATVNPDGVVVMID
jgi:cytochrome b6-f complex iron-sulfur subunit